MLKYPKVGIKRSQILDPYSRLFRGSEEKPKTPVFKELPTKNTQKDNGVIKVTGLQKAFGKHVVLNGVNITIPPGKIFGIIGVNGSGKTTLLRTIIGFYKPTKGVVAFKGNDIQTNLRKIRTSFGFATQDDCFYGNLTIEENIIYFGELYGLTLEFIETHMENVLKMVDLHYAKKTLAKNLSTGMKRRLDIACALIHDPAILILDEPTEDLDPGLRKEIQNLIQRINKNGTTIIMTSHLLWEVENICDYVAILSEGKIIQMGSPTKIKDAYTTSEEIHLETLSGKYPIIVKAGRFKNHKIIGHKLVIYTKKPDLDLKKLLRIIKAKRDKIIELEVRKPTLSEIFEDITKNAKKSQP